MTQEIQRLIRSFYQSPENATKGFVAQTRLFCNDAMTMSQTDEFFANPKSGITAKYPKQWHFTANIANQAATRVLAIMQVADSKTALNIISSIALPIH